MIKHNFSERMLAISSCVLPGEIAADIGTDHGFVPVYLLTEDICPFVIMTDINEGPLKKAAGNLARVCILPQFFELRLGAGLEPVDFAEVSTVIIAGMGAETIIEILSGNIEKSHSFKRFVLQPRKKPYLLRKWLADNGFAIIKESLVKENGNICEIIVAENGNCDGNDIYLPEKLYGDPLFLEYLDRYISKVKIVTDNLTNSKNDISDSDIWNSRLAKALKIRSEFNY